MTSRTTAVVGVVLALAGLLVSVSVVWSRLDSAPTAEPVPGPTPSAVRTPTTTVRSPATDVPRQPASLEGRDGASSDASQPAGPVEVLVRSVSIEADVRPVGVAADGQMQLPANPAVLGWYRFGAAPAAGAGSVVLGGHLDSRRFGLGPLVGLREVVVGDRVTLRMSDGRRLEYVVRRLDRYDRRRLPADVFARTGPERLRLVTCSGEFDPDAGGYRENLVVTASPVAG